MTDPPEGAGEDGSFAGRALAVAGTQVVLLIVGSATSVLIARALGPTGRGEYAFAVAVAMISIALAHATVEQAQIFLFSLGIPVRALAANAVVIALALGILAAGAVLVLCLAVGYPSGAPFHNGALLLALAGVPVSILVIYTNGLLILDSKTNVLNRAALFAGLTQCAVLTILAQLGLLTPTGVVAIWLLNAALPLLVSLRQLRPRPEEFSLSLARRELVTGMKFHAGFASLYLLLRIDLLILAALRSPHELGLYSLAVSLIELTNVATDSVATAILHRQATSTIWASAALTARTIGIALVSATAAVAVLGLSATTLVPLVFGRPFAGTIPALYSLAPGILALAATRSARGYLIRLARPGILTLFAGVALLVNIILNLILIPPLGIVGAGIASSVSYSGLAIGYLTWVRRSAALAWRAFLPWRQPPAPVEPLGDPSVEH